MGSRINFTIQKVISRCQKAIFWFTIHLIDFLLFYRSCRPTTWPCIDHGCIAVAWAWNFHQFRSLDRSSPLAFAITLVTATQWIHPINDDQIQIILNFGSCSDNSHDSDDEMAVLKIQDEADRFFLARLWPASFSLMDPCNLRKDEAEKIRTYNLRYACANRRSRSLSAWRSLAVRELWLGRVNR